MLKKRIKVGLSNPNNLTLFRVLAIPAVVVLLLFTGRFPTFLAALIFSTAAITDYFDGYFARKFEMTSRFGKIMDPLADKLLVCSSFIMLVSHGWVPAWGVCIIVARELAVTALRNVVGAHGRDVSASWLGKYKTGFQIAAIIPLTLHYQYFGIRMDVIGDFFMWGAIIFSIWSGLDYFLKNRDLILP